MSALPPKADIAERNWDVRFVPKGDITPPYESGWSAVEAALASDQIDAVRQFIAAHFGAREVGHQHHSTRLDGRDKSIGHAASAHVRDQQINGALPFRLCNPGNDALVGNDASEVQFGYSEK